MISVQENIVRDIAPTHGFVQDWMLVAAQSQLSFFIEFGLDQGVFHGRRGQGEQHIQFRECGCPLLDRSGLCPDLISHLIEYLLLQGGRPFLGGQDFGFHLFQFRGDEALCIGQSLLADVILRNQMQIRPRDLQIVAEDIII